MRIVGGSNRGRRIVAPPGPDIRPTSDRAREAVFNILEHGGFGADGGTVVPEARVLDAFAGTGAYAFEALSRGAVAATLLDTSDTSLSAARETARTIGETERITLLRRDATAPGRAPAVHDLAFLDPPYGSGLAWRALKALRRQGWFAAETLAIVEVAAAEEIPDLPEGVEMLRDRRYGAARLLFLRLTGPISAAVPPPPPPS